MFSLGYHGHDVRLQSRLRVNDIVINLEVVINFVACAPTAEQLDPVIDLIDTCSMLIDCQSYWQSLDRPWCM